MQLNKVSISILQQLIFVTEQLSDEQYAASLDVLSSNSYGKHLRHILEFYDLMLIGYKSGSVNYDRRSHDKVIESNRVLAIEKLNAMIFEIEEIKADKSLSLVANYEIDKEDSIAINTSFARELQYNIEHAIHHMAIMKIAITNSFKDVSVPEGFGIAYSTLKYEKENHVHGKLPS